MLIRSNHPSCRSRYSNSSPCPGSVPVLASATLRDFFVTILALLACGAVCAQSRLTPPAQNNVEPATPGEGAQRSPGKHLAAAEKSRKSYLTFQIRRAGLSADDLITYRGFYISKDGLAVAPLQAFDSGDFMARNETDGSEVKVVGLIAVEAEMYKVTWPTRVELVRSSMVVMVVIFFLAGVLYFYDLFWRVLLSAIGVVS